MSARGLFRPKALGTPFLQGGGRRGGPLRPLTPAGHQAVRLGPWKRNRLRDPCQRQQTSQESAAFNTKVTSFPVRGWKKEALWCIWESEWLWHTFLAREFTWRLPQVMEQQPQNISHPPCVQSISLVNDRESSWLSLLLSSADLVALQMTMFGASVEDFQTLRNNQMQKFSNFSSSSYSSILTVLRDLAPDTDVHTRRWTFENENQTATGVDVQCHEMFDPALQWQENNHVLNSMSRDGNAKIIFFTRYVLISFSQIHLKTKNLSIPTIFSLNHLRTKRFESPCSPE